MMANHDSSPFHGHYQVAFFAKNGNPEPLMVQNSLEKAAQELGLDPYATFRFFQGDDLLPDEDGPLLGIFFGSPGLDAHPTNNLLKNLLQLRVPIFPVNDTSCDFSNQVPKELAVFNGLSRKENWLNALTILIVEAFGLLRNRRKLFISYYREESAGVATQLCERLSAQQYHPFLDTRSIDAGQRFQDALKEQLVDADLLIFLHTPKAMTREFVKDEIDEAKAVDLAILHVYWPDVPLRDNDKSPPYTVSLTATDFRSTQLVTDAMDRIVKEVETLRIQAVARKLNHLRHGCTRIIRENCGTLRKDGFRWLDILDHCKRHTRIHLVDGVPTIADYRRAAENANTEIIRNGLFMDGRGLGLDTLADLHWLTQSMRSWPTLLDPSRLNHEKLPDVSSMDIQKWLIIP